MARDSIVGDKSLAFAKRVAKCYRFLLDKKKESILSKQILRSGTSIGANIREGLYAQSRKDFISKMNIAFLRRWMQRSRMLTALASKQLVTQASHFLLFSLI